MRLLTIILAALLEIVPAGQAYLRRLQPRDSILIADQLEYGFRLEGVKAGTGFGLQDFGAMDGDTITIVRNWQIDTLKCIKGRKGVLESMDLSASLVLAPFEEGHYSLPPISVQRTLPDGSIDTLVFEPVEMDVKTMPVDTATFVIHDIKGQMRYPVTFREVLPWIAAVLLLAALGYLVYILLKKRAERRGEAPRSKDSAYIVALRELDKYRGDKFWAPERQKAFYSGITDTLKVYIEDRFGVDAPEMTTAELFDALKEEKSLTPELFNATKTLFETADFVKFAKLTVTDEDNAKALPAAVRFVTSTYQSELEEEQGKDVL